MAGKKSGKALLREEGLERTDNGMSQTSWPEVPMINQKNYYTEYMKRDDQILPFRIQADENREKMAREARQKDRAMNVEPEATDDVDDAEEEDDEDAELEEGSKTIVIHPGSQNLRIGRASDALPKTIPMAIASRFTHTESDETKGYEPLPKRRRLSGKAEELFGDDFAKKYAKMSADLKVEMRANKRKVLPNSKELAITYNKRTPPEEISEHNDPIRVDWTDVQNAEEQDYRVGAEAQRIPDDSNPTYKLWWPIQYGVWNEKEYWARERIYNEFEDIIVHAITKELDIKYGRLDEYNVVWIIPDIYEKTYVEALLHISFNYLEFKRVTFVQESLAATYGAGITVACVVDVGAQKTSIACIDEGLILEESRVNLKYGGYDVTETFMKMMLHDSFPYADINLRRRYDFLLAEELKMAHCTMNQADIAVQTYNFHLRAPHQPTRKYFFKTYDETILAPMGFYDPSIFENEDKLRGRRTLIDRHYNFYDPDLPDDPVPEAQLAILKYVKPSLGTTSVNGLRDVDATPSVEKSNPLSSFQRLNGEINGTPQVRSAAASPAPEGTPVPNGNGSPEPSGNAGPNGSHSGTPAPTTEASTSLSAKELAEERDTILPVAPLDTAILTSVTHAVSRASDDDRAKRLRDYLGGIMVVGGGAKVPGFGNVLEERLKARRPDLADKILVAMSPKDLDGQVVVWKGGSVFARMRLHESWLGRQEYDLLGARALHYRAIWFY